MLAAAGAIGTGVTVERGFSPEAIRAPLAPAGTSGQDFAGYPVYLESADFWPQVLEAAAVPPEFHGLVQPYVEAQGITIRLHDSGSAAGRVVLDNSPVPGIDGLVHVVQETTGTGSMGIFLPHTALILATPADAEYPVGRAVNTFLHLYFSLTDEAAKASRHASDVVRGGSGGVEFRKLWAALPEIREAYAEQSPGADDATLRAQFFADGMTTAFAPAEGYGRGLDWLGRSDASRASVALAYAAMADYAERFLVDLRIGEKHGHAVTSPAARPGPVPGAYSVPVTRPAVR